MPLKWVISVVMWLFITLRSVFASPMELTQDGSCECQTVVCPRMRWPWARAWLTIWSAGPKLKLPRDGSTASHFISFSGVIMLNSRSEIAAYRESPSLPAATAVPKYRPDGAACVPRLAAPAELGRKVVTPATSAEADSPIANIRRRRLSRCRPFMILLGARGSPWVP